MRIRWRSTGQSALRPALVVAVLLIGTFGLVVPSTQPAHAASVAYTLRTLRPVTGGTFTAFQSANPVNGAGLIAGYILPGKSGGQEAAVFDTRTSTVRPLGSLVAGLPSSARDVNIRGDVVGSARVSENISHGFVVRAGTNKMVDLGPSDPAISSDAFSINDFGVIAGWTADSFPLAHTFAVTWTLNANGGYTTYNIGKAVGSTSSRATVVNNGGYVLFSRDDKGVTWSFVWLPEKHYAMQIKPLPGDDTVLALDMNEAGFAVGVSSSRKKGGNRPILWSSQSQTTQLLPDLAGSIGSTPTAINAKGTIVGIKVIVDGANSWTKPVVWDRFGASVANLPTGTNPSAIAFGINVYGLVVGQPGRGLDEGTVVWKPVTT